MTTASLLLVLGSYAIKSTAIFGIAALACLLLRKFGPSYRHLVWTVGFAGILVLPILEFVVPRHYVPLIPAAQTPVQTPMEAPVPDPAMVSVTDTTLPVPAASPELPLTPPPKPTFPLPLAVIAVWAGGALIFLGQQLISLWLLSRSAARCLAASTDRYEKAVQAVGVTCPWRLVFGRIAGAPGPMMWGVFRPTVAMPEESRYWAPDQFESVLMHELVHIKRLDSLTQSLAGVVCALNWFNPAAWLSLHALRRESESATDLAVLGAGVKPSTYADALLHTALEARNRRRSLLYAGVPLMKQSKIEARVRAVLSPESQDLKVTRFGALAAFAAALLVVAPCATLQASSVAAKEADQPAPQTTRAMLKQAMSVTAGLVSATPKKKHQVQHVHRSSRKRVLSLYQHLAQIDQMAHDKVLQEQLAKEEAHLAAAQQTLTKQRQMLDAQKEMIRQQEMELARQQKALDPTRASEAQLKASQAALLALQDVAKERENQYNVGLIDKADMLKARADLLAKQSELVNRQSTGTSLKGLDLKGKDDAIASSEKQNYLKAQIAAQAVAAYNKQKYLNADIAAKVGASYNKQKYLSAEIAAQAADQEKIRTLLKSKSTDRTKEQMAALEETIRALQAQLDQLKKAQRQP